MKDEATTRDRLLLAAAELLDGSGGRDVSTRAVCERAGVSAPTLYHHFGSKQGLVDAVVNYGFAQYVAGAADSGDPVADLRAGWDAHVRYGLDNPSFYVLLHGRIRTGVPCAVTGPATAALSRLLDAAAGRGLLRAPVADAAAQILAANVGVTLSLIGRPAAERDLGLSVRAREAALDAVLTTAEAAPAGVTRAGAAVTLRAALAADPAGLTPGEAGLLGELLDRLARG
ncbi:TetR/AcrR family transcriptional regulator [Actinoplanes sp. ATCC 53533]|uniref:TetR/AcrR family transcriptional regulator n=1 Tax=Actinoplanes sp. ATCC 53533 TaxID=1288362 RepID=UPI0018F4B7AA|nr:TetR/AcrR family transcriptional regulator [Actinoplanes sp. ATCC 53533]